MDHCHLAMIDMIDWTNLEGDRFHNDLSKPLPLVGPPDRKLSQQDDRQWFYKGSIGHKSPYDVYSKIKIIRAKRITVEKKYGYGYLKDIMVKRADQKEYTFVEADFPRLNQNDIEDLYLLKIHDKIYNIDGMDEIDLINALQLYICIIPIKKRVEDAHLRIVNGQRRTSKGQGQFCKRLRRRLETLKVRRRFRRLECFVGGRINEIDYRLLAKPE
ncbi:hypothetical protein Tco_0347517 [Tanacetum coccineum]